MLGVLKVVRAILKPFVSLILGAILLGLGLTWAGWIISYISSFPIQNYIGPSPSIMTYLGGFSIFTFIGIPILSLMLWITRWFSSYRIPAEWRSYLRIGWAASFVFTAITVLMTVMSFNSEAEETVSNIIDHNGDVLEIQHMTDQRYENNGFLQIFDAVYTSDALVSDNVHYEILKGEGPEVVLEIVKRSNGKSYNDARDLISDLDMKYIVEGDVLQLSKHLLIDKGNKFRAQRAIYRLYVPEGKTIKMDREISRGLYHTEFVNNEFRPREMHKFDWTMTENGLVSEGWNEEFSTTKELSTKNIENLNIDGRLYTTISQGAKAKITLSGPREELNRISEISTDGALTLKTKGRVRNVKLNVITPSLESLQAKGLRTLKVQGFKQDRMELNFAGDNCCLLEAEIYVDVEQLSCSIDKYGDHTFIGSAKDFTVNLLRGATINAEQFKATNVKVNGDIKRGSTFYADSTFECGEYKRGNITLFGTPKETLIPHNNR